MRSFLIIIQIYFFFLPSSSFANTCNSNKIKCIYIPNYTSNSSKYFDGLINKISILKKDIDVSNKSSLTDILKDIPQLDVVQSGAKGQQTSVFIRGSGSNHALVMINGVSINDQSTTQGLHDFGVDFISSIQKIEIYPGSNSSHFGSNAIGGAINLILGPDLKNNFKIGGFNKKNNNFHLNKTTTTTKNSIYNFKLNKEKTKKLSALSSGKEKDEAKYKSSNLNYDKVIDDNTKFFSRTFLRETTAQYDKSITDEINNIGKNKMYFQQLGFEKKLKNSKSLFQLYGNKYDRKYNESNIIDTYKSNKVGAQFNYDNFSNKKISYGVISSLEHHWGFFDNNGSYEASTKGNVSTSGIGFNAGYKFNQKSKMGLLVRNDFHSETKNNQTYKVSYKQIIKSFDVTVARMTAMRNPTLYELYGTDNYGYSGNKNLKPEKSFTNELSIKYPINQNLNIATELFKTNIINQIEYKSNKYVNNNDNQSLKQSGSNIALNYDHDNTKLTVFSNFLSSKKKDGSAATRRPSKKFGTRFYKEFKKKNNNYNFVILNATHNGKYYDTHSTTFSTISMKSVNLLDITVGTKINNSLFSFSIYNLTDDNYDNPHGYSQNGRNFYFGFKKNLN